MAVLTLILFAVYILAGFVVRTVLQLRRTYLLTTHGDTHPQYAATTGRFLPHIGRLLG